MKIKQNVMCPKDHGRVLRQIERLDKLLLEKCEAADRYLSFKREEKRCKLMEELRSKNLIEFEL